MSKPPVAKYTLTLHITGNSHDEIETELAMLANGGYVDYSIDHTADVFNVHAPRVTAMLEHTNPDQTADGYRAELDKWFSSRRRDREELQ